MPRAVLTRQQFQGFRRGRYLPSVNFRFSAPTWDLDEVEPSPFSVPSCVVFGQRSGAEAEPLPDELEVWSARLPRRNVSASVAKPLLHRTRSEGPSAGEHRSHYHSRFSQGATVVPRVLVIVEAAPTGPLGVGSGRRAVRSQRSALEKRPWKDLPSLEGVVEQQFVRPLLLGSSILPYRTVTPAEAIVPWNGERLLHGEDVALEDYAGLSAWWLRAEALWIDNRRSDRMTLIERQDFHRGLSSQFPIPALRIVYTQAGVRLAAARVEDTRAVVDHKLYWATASSVEEARYLTAILNSAELTRLVQPYQSRGEFGPRDFDKYVFYVPIPLFDEGVDAHRELAALATRAEAVAAGVDVSGVGFQRARTRVRAALETEGVATEIEEAVAQLLS
jgi:hypothetical protein